MPHNGNDWSSYRHDPAVVAHNERMAAQERAKHAGNGTQGDFRDYDIPQYPSERPQHPHRIVNY